MTNLSESEIHTSRYNFFNEELQRLKLGFEAKLDYIEFKTRSIDEKILHIFERIKYIIEILELDLVPEDDEENGEATDIENL